MTLKKTFKESRIKSKILIWYKKNGRKLPWRKKKGTKKFPDSYNIFVSEFMLQQTTVNAVIPKFNKFVKTWPTIQKLSKIRESKILEFWSGLGYYSRARNLLKSIKIISKQHNNIIPKEFLDLIKLPGVGNYTARAVQGIAYNLPVMPVDSNIERIISRVYGIKVPVSNSNPLIKSISNKLISKKHSSNFIQALMDYGSIICIPKKPICSKCLIKNYCLAFKEKLTNSIPVKKKKNNLKKIKYTRAYLVMNEFNQFLVRKRPAEGMLQSMIEFPNDKWVENRKKLVRDDLINLFSFKFYKLNKNITYSFSHFDLNIEIYFAKVKKCNFKKQKWISKNNIDKSGLPTVMKKIASLYQD